MLIFFPESSRSQERSSYLEYQKLIREIQHLSRLYVAWLFVCAEETKLKSAENLKVMQDNIAKMQASMAENESKVQELTAQIQELQKKKDQVLDSHPSLFNLTWQVWGFFRGKTKTWAREWILNIWIVM